MDIASLSIEMSSAAAGAARWAFGGALLAAAIECGLIRWVARRPYGAREAAMSLLMGVGYARAAALGGLLWGWLYFLCWELRVLTPAIGWPQQVMLLLLVDFCFYWQHRWAHATRWGWASHLQHHSVEQMNMAAPFRLSVTSAVSGFPAFYAPLALLGFPPALVAVHILLNVGLQVLLHTETVGRLGLLERVFNTPAHHRVHHASNAAYLDRNFGGLLIVWDKLFGSFQAELPGEPPVYGLVTPLAEQRFVPRLLLLWFGEWRAMARDAWRAPRWSQRLRHLFGPPGWRPGA
jgi:sterol desaturase/sphingolipid hydroxylase (fatty acid hydroxylase superfamily)